MENLIERLIESVDKLNSFSWNDGIALLSLIASWITIVFLLKERSDSNRPYLQITFELVKSNLACIVLKNVGNVPLTIKELNFDELFVSQLEKTTQEKLKKKIQSLNIFPNRNWIISLDVIVPDILEKFKEKELEITYKYTKLNKKKQYSENIVIDFEQYSKFLAYVSEIDELKKVSEKISKDIKELKKSAVNTNAKIISYIDLKDKIVNNIVAGYEIDKD